MQIAKCIGANRVKVVIQELSSKHCSRHALPAKHRSRLHLPANCGYRGARSVGPRNISSAVAVPGDCRAGSCRDSFSCSVCRARTIRCWDARWRFTTLTRRRGPAAGGRYRLPGHRTNDAAACRLEGGRPSGNLGTAGQRLSASRNGPSDHGGRRHRADAVSGLGAALSGPERIRAAAARRDPSRQGLSLLRPAYGRVLAGVDDFRRAGVEVCISTEDGSAGHRGRVAELVPPLVEASELPCRIVACGPERMLHATATMAKRLKLPCEVSLESPMACGIGICFSCVTKVRDERGRVGLSADMHRGSRFRRGQSGVLTL